MGGETGRALLAGFVSGAIVALITTLILLFAIMQSAWWRRRAAGETGISPAIAGIAIANGLLLVWTALGLVLGAVYLAIEERAPEGFLGSGSWLFSLLVLAGIVTLIVPFVLVRRRLVRSLWQTALVAAVCFGWLLPALAQ